MVGARRPAGVEDRRMTLWMWPPSVAVIVFEIYAAVTKHFMMSIDPHSIHVLLLLIIIIIILLLLSLSLQTLNLPSPSVVGYHTGYGIMVCIRYGTYALPMQGAGRKCEDGGNSLSITSLSLPGTITCLEDLWCGGSPLAILTRRVRGLGLGLTL